MRNEIEAALQSTTEMLSQVTRLLALVSAPPLEAATVRHVEVLLLQPSVVMVVVITSTRRRLEARLDFDAAGRPRARRRGPREYLNEQRRRPAARHAHAPRSGSTTRASRRASARSSTRCARRSTSSSSEEQRLFVGGAAGLLGELRADELEACQRLLELLERRAALLEVLGEALDSRARRSSASATSSRTRRSSDVALVGAGYGLRTATLGTVSLLGPLRMDYEKAIRSVRAAAHRALALRRGGLRGRS